MNLRPLRISILCLSAPLQPHSHETIAHIPFAKEIRMDSDHEHEECQKCDDLEQELEDAKGELADLEQLMRELRHEKDEEIQTLKDKLEEATSRIESLEEDLAEALHVSDEER